MKISVCGKGGSGKSTVTALMANEARTRGYRVLVVDSDESNSGLFRMLGFDQPPVPLMDMLGGKPGLKQKMAEPSILAESQLAISDIPQGYLLHKDGISMVAIGKIMQSLEGCACPMGVLSREFLKKLSLREDELVIVDMEAGVEHFGRGVDASLDSVLVVIEPPLESVNVGQKIHDLASGMGIKKVWAIMNKVPSAEIVNRLQAELQERHIETIGCLYYDAAIFNESLGGEIPPNGVSVDEMKNILALVLSKSGLPTSRVK